MPPCERATLRHLAPARFRAALRERGLSVAGLARVAENTTHLVARGLVPSSLLRSWPDFEPVGATHSTFIHTRKGRPKPPLPGPQPSTTPPKYCRRQP